MLNRIIRSVSQNRRRTIHQLVLIAEAGGRCCRCQGIHHSSIYDFHHKDPSKKAFSLDRSVYGKKLSALRKEAAKCILLCANCHRYVHAYRELEYLVVSDTPDTEKVYVAQELELD